MIEDVSMSQTKAVPFAPSVDELIAGLRDGSPAAELLIAFASAADLVDARRRLRAVLEAWTAGEEPAR